MDGMAKTKLLVIGAGASGLTAIKCCLDEGLEPVCFERSSYVGGLWHYTDEVEEGQACVMKSTVANTSKEMMCYSDFPIPSEFAMYMRNTKVDCYLNMYADNLKLKEYIQLNRETYDAVLVCSCHHSDKNIPDFPGLDKCMGSIIHTRDYKDFHEYEDRRVLVIRIGNLGVDVATELCKVSSKLRMAVILVICVDHEKYSLQPNFPPFSAAQTFSDDLANRVATGSVIVKANVSRFTENGVVFEDGTGVDAIDNVVMATRYSFGFPFLDRSIIEVKENRINLFKYMFPPDDDHHTLAIIGCVKPVGAILPISEMQCRQNEPTWSRYDVGGHPGQTGVHSSALQCVSDTYNNKKLCLTDPRLALDVFFGPTTPYQYLLHGPGAWKSASECIRTQWERTYKPLKTRPCNLKQADGSGAMKCLVVLIVALLAYFFIF
ncbi:FMO5-like protein [Mya arenaria]|uniref:Flavin-containing monooxygenase n=1 Tax=Mya arenaria TaxID=6604 RepID=A0ABY7ERS5_MYAAR|nr:FMO5-like protein [Mya arenaria]